MIYRTDNIKKTKNEPTSEIKILFIQINFRLIQYIMYKQYVF